MKVGEDKEISDWPALLFLLIVLPFAFTFGGVWVGVSFLFVGVIALGWRKRHKGPFPTNKAE